MDFWKVLPSRHCVRSFDPGKEIPDDKVEKILSAAKMAPSAGNAQDWEFIVIRAGKIKQQLVEAAGNQDFIAPAPVVIIVCLNFKKINPEYGQRGRELYAIQDTAAAAQNILLAATALGLGACWVGAFDEAKVKGVLGLGQNLRPVVIIPIGYPK